MLKIKQKAIAMAVMISLGIPYSQKAEASVVVTDPGNFLENLAGNIQDAANWAEEKSTMMFSMDLDALLAEMMVDNDNNAISNLIVRTGAALEEIQNIEILEMSIPDGDAADTVTLQVLEESATCSSAIGASEEAKERLSEHCQFEMDLGEQITVTEDIITNFVAECTALGESSGEEGDTGINKTTCTEATNILGVGTLDTLSHSESESVKKYIQLVAGVTPSIKKSYKFEDGSKLKNKELIKEMRLEAVRSMVQTSLSEIAFMRIGGDEVKFSPLHLLSQFDEDRYGSTKWTSSLANVDPDSKNSIMPSEILRKMAVMDSFMVHMSVLSYKQSLREEAINATRLAVVVEPL